MNVEKLLEELTLEEKASLCSGIDFWRTQPIDRLNIPSIEFCDGPHGLRAQREAGEGEKQEDIDPNDNIKATAFPAACLTACSFDTSLLEEEGKYLAEEARAEGINILLGPGNNMKRSPLCGRNFEYFSEDPYLSGKLSAAYIKGLQEQGVGAALKHFAANNQEYSRFSINEIIDEKTLREIYLYAFEIAINESEPWVVMSSYNAINGVLASENEYLLTEILRNRYKFTGLTVSDWGAVSTREKSVKAGLDLEMPASGGINDREIVKAVREGRLEEKYLDNAVRNVLKLIKKCLENFEPVDSYDKEEHHAFASKLAEES
ncbi:MAG: glycosyl hydrolase, partial [Clostridiales Family XIII bacterium]|nr:glycosyl hydrolase [Clostridiales Family XIII bacterium]